MIVGLSLSVSMGMSVSVRVSVHVTMRVTCMRNPKLEMSFSVSCQRLSVRCERV